MIPRRLRSWWRLRRDTVLGAAEAEIVTLAQILKERTDERDKALACLADALRRGERLDAALTAAEAELEEAYRSRADALRERDQWRLRALSNPAAVEAEHAVRNRRYPEHGRRSPCALCGCLHADGEVDGG